MKYPCKINFAPTENDYSLSDSDIPKTQAWIFATGWCYGGAREQQKILKCKQQ